MTLAELEHHEAVALLALLGLMARLDGKVSADERGLFDRVVEELGSEVFGRVAADAARLDGTEAVLLAASDVERPEAREVLFELLYDMAVREGIADREAKLLDWMSETWSLPQRSAGASDEDEA